LLAAFGDVTKLSRGGKGLVGCGGKKNAATLLRV